MCYKVVWINNFSKSSSKIKFEKCRQFPLQKKSIMCVTLLFAVSKDKFGTNVNDKSMKNALYVLWYARRYLFD